MPDDKIRPLQNMEGNDQSGEVTRLLREWSSGNRGVEDRLFSLVLPDLRNLARRLMAHERPDHSLEATALMNEVYFRLVGARERDWENRKHFFSVAARVMRHLLIDYARQRRSGAKVPIAGLEDLLEGRDAQLELGVQISSLLDEMDVSHPDWCSVIELKFFVGLTDAEVAEALNLSLRTMQRQFGDARRWLYKRLQPKQTPTD